MTPAHAPTAPHSDFECLKFPAKDIRDLLSEIGTPKKIVLPMASRDHFLHTLRSFLAFDGWDLPATQWTTGVVYEHSSGHTTDRAQTTVAPLVRHVRGAELHFSQESKAQPEITKLRRVHVDRLLVFRHRGWEYTFRCRWSAATLSPGIESLVEQRAAPAEYAVVIGRSDWDAYAAANTTTHVAESIRMKVEDIRRIIF